jgi:hypothetical protein
MKQSLRRDRRRGTPRSAEPRLIGSVSRVIAKFHNSELTITSMLSRATALLHQFVEDPALLRYRRLVDTADEVLIASAGRAIDAMHQASLIAFNPFLTSGFNPNEDEFSDALAELFSPHYGHGFKQVLLRSLIAAAARKVVGTELIAVIEGITAALDRTDPALIKIIRNYYHPDGKPDIVILGTDPSAQFIILIENKKLGGRETFTSKGHQTNRHYKILKEIAAHSNIDEHLTIAIFLTPTGISAIDRSFIALSTQEPSSSMLEALDTVGTETDKRSLYLAVAWVMTYEWLNGGVP